MFEAYLKSNPLAFVVETDPQTGEHIHKFKLVREPPADIKHLFRNALLDVKHSFDRPLQAAVHAQGFRGFDRNYPWTETIIGLKKTLRKRQSKKKTAVSIPILKEIFRQHPYSGSPSAASGQDLVREIANMANDKHSIGFEVSASVHSLSITGGMFFNTGIEFGGWDSVKKELIVARSAPDGRAFYGDTKLTTDIFFNRTGDLGQIPAWIALWHFADRAQVCLEGFKRAASD